MNLNRNLGANLQKFVESPEFKFKLMSPLSDAISATQAVDF